MFEIEIDRRLWSPGERAIKEEVEALERKADELKSEHSVLSDNQAVLQDRIAALERKLDEILEYVRYIKRF